MTQRLVVIGGSAGGLDALRTVVAALPADFPAAVLAVLHVSPDGESMLPEILNRSGPLPARAANHGDPLTPGTITVARPDRHLVVYDDVVHVSRGPRENRHRPAIDPLFTTAARWHGPNVIGVVLSGALDDGAAGAAAIAAQDGLVVVQDPAEATVTGMPSAALRAVRRARTARADQIGRLLVELTQAAAPPGPNGVGEMINWESANVDSTPAENRPPSPGTGAAVGCPECGGGMFEAGVNGRLLYHCHVGHSWSAATLLAAQREATEAALYGAAAKLYEEATVLRRIAAEFDEPDPSVEDLLRRAASAERRATDIENMLRDVD